MGYDILFCDSALEDLTNLTIYELQFTHSLDVAEAHMDGLVNAIIEGLLFFPARNPERAYGFTDALRRSYRVGKYTAFYRLDEEAQQVRIDNIAHSKADFNRIHFGN